MDFSLAKVLTFGFEIFRCKRSQLQIQNTANNLTNECLKTRMLHMTKLRVLGVGAGLGLQTSGSNFDIMALLVTVHNIPRGNVGLKVSLRKSEPKEPVTS